MKENNKNAWAWYTLAFIVWVALAYWALSGDHANYDYPDGYDEHEECGRWC